MRSIRRYLFTLVVSGLASALFSQNEASKWYFGSYAGLDFMSSPPTALTNGALITIEGTSCAADGAGNLLFYTDGVTIWNQTHAVMANGTGLFGNISTSQSALIVKQPGNPNIYFVFTLADAGNPNGLRYSVVDMSLAAGMGSVTAKNILVYAPSTEKLCGVKHCNGTDVWVVSHDYPSNNFRASLVTSAGVSSTAVVSALGSVIMQQVSTAGCMKISPNGKKLGLAVYDPPSFELYDFNTATGVVSNYVSLTGTLPAGEFAYGCEFSPDGTKFYGTNDGDIKFYQWDLCAGSASAIIASQHTIAASETEEMQLGPDGKIYVARANGLFPINGSEYMLGVIHNPNAAFSAINYVNTGQSVFPKVSESGLPNFVSGFYKTPVAQFTYAVNPAISCVTASFSAPPLLSNTCSATSYTVDHLTWLFGDGASGSANTSTLANPVHSYPGNGVYTARLILYNPCGGVIDTLKQPVLITQVPISTSSSGFSLCAGQSMTLYASGLSTYSWSTGATTATIGIAPGATTTYTVEGLGLNSCPLKSIQTVTVNPIPVVTVSGSQTACIGSAFTQTASGATSYTWNNGTVGPWLNVLTPVSTTYAVTGEANGCLSSAVTSVSFLPVPQINVSGASSVCLGSGALQTASGAISYTWSDGSRSNPTTLVPLGTMAFTVTGTGANGCNGYATVTLTSYYLPFVSISGNHTICSGSALTLTASGASGYSWSNAENTAVISVSPAATSVFTVTGTDAATGCSNTANVQVYVSSSPTLSANSASICSGATATLSVSSPGSPGTNFTWLPGATSGSQIAVTGTIDQTYTVVATSAEGCTETATASLYLLNPYLTISPSVTIAPGTRVTLHVSGGISYTWSPIDNLSCSDCDSPIAFPSNTTRYCVSAGQGSCVSSLCTDVSVTCETENDFSVPNAFTPNGDHTNDAFCLQGWNECTSDFRVMIFDRWGEKVFESADPLFCWDGVYNGVPLSTGVFVYAIHAKKNNGEPIDKKGNITLIR